VRPGRSGHEQGAGTVDDLKDAREAGAHAILQCAGEAGHVGGQEDMITDVALRLREERQTSGGARP
jgi:DmpG-like communication domain